MHSRERGLAINEIPGLTIAIPTYGRCARVRSLVDAIIPQMHPDDELLVIDDNSRDDTAAALGKVPRVRLLVNPVNLGLVRNWNKCMQEASRDWVCIVHDDDTLYPRALEAIRKTCAIVRQPALIAHASSPQATDNSLRYSFWEPGPWTVLHAAVIPSGVTIHRKIVASAGPFDERFVYSPDREFFPRVCREFPLVVIHNPGILQYNLHAENYQYAAWLKPDCLPQLEEIERRIATYAGFPDEEVERICSARMDQHVKYMFDAAVRLGNRELVRRCGSYVCQAPNMSRRWRVKGWFAHSFGWWPKS